MTTNFSFSFKIWLEPGSKNPTVGALWDICIAINDRMSLKTSHSLLGATTLGVRQSGRLQEVIAYRRNQQNKRNTGLIS